MSLFIAWFLYPLVLAALCCGLGLLIDVLAGRRLPGVLVGPVGLATMIVVGQFTTWTDATAELTVPVVVLLAVLGVGLSFPWRFGRLDPWPAAVAVGVFLVFGAPVILSGSPTFAGYIKLDDTATWLALTDRLMEHGRSLDGLDFSTYYATLKFNLAGGYPIGAFIPLGTAQKLVGGDLAWVFQPYLAFLAAMLSLALWQIVDGVVPRRSLRALVAFVAAQPALLFGYALWGGVKEMVTAMLIALAAALGVAAVAPDARSRDVVPLALVAGALVGVLGVGGLVWVGPMLLALAALAWRRRGSRRGVKLGVAFALAVGLFAVPVLVGNSFSPFQSTLTEERELGNLIEALNPLQVLGIWPAGDFRVDPDGAVITAILIALAGFAALIGLWAVWRHRSVALLLFATSLIACAAVVFVGSPWVDGKALASAAPAALVLAIVGAVTALRLDRPTGVALVVIVAGGVIWSNVIAYGSANLAPRGQLAELEKIGKEFAGQGPALMTEYNPYGARHFLRNLDGEGVSELRIRTVPLRRGGTAEKGEAVDTDEILLDGLFEFRTLVLRRSPTRSRPPWPYRLAFSGDYYEVWKRPESYAGPIPAFLPLGDGIEPAAVPSCPRVVAFARSVEANASSGATRLLAARHAPVYGATDGNLGVPRAGRYAAWLMGSVRGADALFVDGHEVGQVRHELNDAGGFIDFGDVRLSTGEHSAVLSFGGADLHPGSGGFPRPEVGPLLFAPYDEEWGELVSVPLDEASRLCGVAWDWIEAAPPG